MPYNTSSRELNDLLNFIEENFGITIPANRVNGWLADISGKGTNNRSMQQLRLDILEHVVGTQNVENWVRQQFGDASIGTSQESEADRLARIVNDIMTGARTFKDTSDDIKKATGQSTGPSDVPTKPGPPKEEEKAEVGVGGGGEDPETQLTILTSNNMNWYFDKGSGKWFVSYALPHSGMNLVFEADPDQMDALFGKGMRPTNYETVSTQTLLAREGIIFSGNIAEMEGTGRFEDEYEKVIAIAKNNGQLPSWMQGDASALDLLFIAQTDNKSNEWLLNEFSKLESFKARFPGLQQLQSSGNLTLSQAIGGFLEFEAGIKQASSSLGFNEAVTPAIVGGLLGRGWSLQDTVHAMQNFKRQKDFAPALDAFNQILQAKGLQPLTSQQDLFDFMDGKAPAEYYDIYEASSVQEAATQAGLGDLFTAQDAIDAALAGDFDRGSATQAMQKAAQLLLRLRFEVAVDKYGLNTDELIDISLGMAPTSGRSEVEVFEAVNRATLEAQARLKDRARPFQGFTPTGRVQAQSLGALRNES